MEKINNENRDKIRVAVESGEMKKKLKPIKKENNVNKKEYEENPELNCWNGGNIVASLSTFNKMLVYKKEWEECGKNIIHVKNI